MPRLISIHHQVTFNATDKISIIKLTHSSNIKSISYGAYRLTPKSALHSCIDSTNEYNHGSVFQSQYRGDFSQQWIIEHVGDGFYRIINRATRRTLNVDSCNTNDCHKWKFELLLDGYYRITPKHAQEQCLGVHQYSSTDNIKIQKWFWSNTDCQHWKLDCIASTV
jgi:hypothetical protein